MLIPVPSPRTDNATMTDGGEVQYPQEIAGRTVTVLPSAAERCRWNGLRLSAQRSVALVVHQVQLVQARTGLNSTTVTTFSSSIQISKPSLCRGNQGCRRLIQRPSYELLPVLMICVGVQTNPQLPEQ